MSEPGDPDEKEADQIAEQIVGRGDSHLPNSAAKPELAHTIQQSSKHGLERAQGRIQRQSSGSQAAEPPITAQTIFPFPKDSRVVLNRLLADTFFGILSSQAPDVAQMLQAIEGQVATVTTATDDLFEASLSSAVNLPAQGSNPATSITGLTLALRRQPAGTFDFTLTGQTNPVLNPPFGFEQRDLTATREGARIVLSSGAGAGAVPQLRVTPGGPTGQTQIEGFTAPFLSQIPDALRGIVPARIELLQLSRLPDVPVGTAAERDAIRDLTSQIANQRREPRRRLTLGGGVQFGAQTDPLLTAAWQINFTPSRTVPFIKVPLEVQLQYAPSSTVLVGVSTGAEISLSQLDIPVNVRILSLGFAGGSIEGSAPPGSTDRPDLAAYGPTIGAGAGVELGRFRFDLRYEHFANLAHASPNADSVFARVGVGF